MTGVTANFVLEKLSPLVMTGFSDRKSLLSFLIIDIQPPHFSLLFNMVYHVVDLFCSSLLIIKLLIAIVAKCEEYSAPLVLSLRTTCADAPHKMCEASLR